MALTLVDRFRPQLRREQQAAIDAGELRKRDELELLAPEQIRPLTLLSLLMFVAGIVFFSALNIAAYVTQTQETYGRPGGWGLLVWIGINILNSVLILPIHEIIHGLAFLFWGGKPHFGAKLPFALYCGARNQLFHRNQYIAVGLAPFVVITLAAILFILLAPALASYTLLAAICNFSGAAGDVWAVARLLRYPHDVLVEDTETGFIIWELAAR